MRTARMMAASGHVSTHFKALSFPNSNMMQQVYSLKSDICVLNYCIAHAARTC